MFGSTEKRPFDAYEPPSNTLYSADLGNEEIEVAVRKICEAMHQTGILLD